MLRGPVRTLDAGCGSGAFTMYASRIGNESLGISIDEREIQTAQERTRILGISNIELIRADLRELDRFHLGKFDQVICLETIEHITNDEKLVKDFSDLLEPGGRLLLTTPFKHYRPLRGDTLSSLEDGGHVRWGYTHEEIRELFDKCGLDVHIEEYISGYVSQQITSLMRSISTVNARFAWVVVFPLRIFQVFDSPVTRLIGYPYLSIGVVGIKR